jgi:ligand-binding SRPBCC domain-containing protein
VILGNEIVQRVEVETFIAAPIERCFDLARSVDAHVHSAGQTGEKVLAGRLSGLLELGENVTWEARHLGIRQRLTSQITVFDRPTFFQDRMTQGAFRHFEHDHLFTTLPNGQTRMTDVLRFQAPFGFIGRLLERLLIGPHLKQFLTRRGVALKEMAESETWRNYV